MTAVIYKYQSASAMARSEDEVLLNKVEAQAASITPATSKAITSSAADSEISGEPILRYLPVIAADIETLLSHVSAQMHPQVVVNMRPACSD